MKFRKFTPAQRMVMEALRALGGRMDWNLADARPIKALARRGLVRVRRDPDGFRVVVLRETAPQRRRRRKLNRQLGLYLPMQATGWIPAITDIE